MKSKISIGFEIVQDLIKLRWVPEILKSIDLGNQRYSDILRSIPYISHTELNRKLTVLTEQNVIFREVEGNATYYTLLNFGEDLIHIFYHLEDIEAKYCQTS